ncbi:MAG: T9SS type A sorting domain-containing protein [Ginsengibacter sp.]
MKKIIIFLMLAITSKAGFSEIAFTTRYNAVTDAFDVYVTSSIGYANFQQGSSTVAILFEPQYNETMASVTTSTNGGPWVAQDKDTITVAGSLNGYKFINFLSPGSAYPLPANTPVKLFSFSFSGVGANCTGAFKQRHIVNSSDPTDPDGAGTYDLTSFLFSPATDYLLSANINTTFQDCIALAVGGPTPVRFLSFTAVKNGNNALLNWNVSNEDVLTHHYEIERSINKIDFVSVATIPAKKNGRLNNTYDLTDLNLSGLNSSGIYYRIKQVDADGNFVYSEVRPLRLNINGFGVKLSPNPAKILTVATIDLAQAFPITIDITDAAGKQIKSIKVAGVKGANIKRVDLSGLAAGSYMLKVKAGDQSQTMPLVKQE